MVNSAVQQTQEIKIANAQAQQTQSAQQIVDYITKTNPELGQVLKFFEEKGLAFGQHGSSNNYVDKPTPGAAYTSNQYAQQVANATQTANAAAAANSNLPKRPGQ